MGQRTVQCSQVQYEFEQETKRACERTDRTNIQWCTHELPHLLQFIGLGLVFVAVRVLAVGHAEPPHCKDAVDVVPDPGILLLGTGRQKSSHWVLQQHVT